MSRLFNAYLVRLCLCSLHAARSSWLNLLITRTSSVPQCAQITDAIKTLAADPLNSNVHFIEVDAEDASDVAKKYSVTSVPSILIFQNGVKVEHKIGVNVPQLVESVVNLRSNDLSARLFSLINKAPVMLFMKGSPEEPRCGFSRKMIDILNSVGTKFETFDILKDESVRQGLKAYSEWPTYPQLYIKGELIGGLDIVKEMADAGELASAINV